MGSVLSELRVSQLGIIEEATVVIGVPEELDAIAEPTAVTFSIEALPPPLATP